MLSTILPPQVQCAVASDSSESTGAASTNVRPLPPARSRARSNRFGRVALHASRALNAATLPSPQEEVEFQAFRTRFGTAHQAVLPPYAPEKPPGDDRSVLVWAPDTATAGPPLVTFDSYLARARDELPDPRLKGSLIELALAAWGAHPGDADAAADALRRSLEAARAALWGAEELVAFREASLVHGAALRAVHDALEGGARRRRTLAEVVAQYHRSPCAAAADALQPQPPARRRPAGGRGAAAARAASPWALSTR